MAPQDDEVIAHEAAQDTPPPEAVALTQPLDLTQPLTPQDEMVAAATELMSLLDEHGISELWANNFRVGASIGRTRAALVALEATVPPVVIDVPHVSQSGDTLHCTMGNWHGSPTDYAYHWLLDEMDAGTDAPDLPVTPDEVGKTAVCVVTATNAAGSTQAPPSNSVVIA